MLVVDSISRTFPRGSESVVAVNDVSFEVGAGAFTALVGPSGSGKSTILNLIAGFDAPDEGQILFEGKDLSAYSPHDWDIFRGTKIGFVFQHFNLIPVLNAIENVEIALYFSGKSRRQRYDVSLVALDSVGLADRLNHRPNQLSGGQQQRVALARALVGNPSLVLADEPTANLDSRTALEIIDLTFSLKRTSNISFIFATHDARIIERATNVLYLEDGSITK